MATNDETPDIANGDVLYHAVSGEKVVVVHVDEDDAIAVVSQGLGKPHIDVSVWELTPEPPDGAGPKVINVASPEDLPNGAWPLDTSIGGCTVTDTKGQEWKVWGVLPMGLYCMMANPPENVVAAQVLTVEDLDMDSQATYKRLMQDKSGTTG